MTAIPWTELSQLRFSRLTNSLCWFVLEALRKKNRKLEITCYFLEVSVKNKVKRCLRTTEVYSLMARITLL